MENQQKEVKYIRTSAEFKGAEEIKQHIYYAPLFYIIEKLGAGTEINLWQHKRVFRSGPPGSNLRWLGIISPDKDNGKNRGATISVEIQFLQTGELSREQFAEVANLITAYRYPPHRSISIPNKYLISVTVQPKKKKPKPKAVIEEVTSDPTA